MIRRLPHACVPMLALCAAAIVAGSAQAQDFPSRTIRLLVGFPAGGPSDVPARLVAEQLRQSLGQPVVVENKTGAAGMIALNEMLAQPRDGHTLLLCSYLDATNTLLYKSVAYKLDDIPPISLVSKAYYAFTVPASLPVADMERVHRLRQGEAGPAQLRQRRRGLGDRDARQAAGEGGRHLHGGRAVPRHRAGAAGGGGRPARVHGRALWRLLCRCTRAARSRSWG